MNPLVSIMIVVKGRAGHLEETLLSLLNQTMQDFEIIIVNGGVDRAAGQILARYSSGDERIKIFEQVEPGISAARNQAIALASGKYCAVNDADDLSLPHRLETQVNFLETHPEVSLCGSWIQTLGAGPAQIRRTPTDDALIRSQMMFLCPFAHSSVMWRREDIARTGELYRWHSSEDYNLWARLLRHISFANLPEVLVHYRQHPEQRSNIVEASIANDERIMRIRQSLVETLGIEPDSQDMRLHTTLAHGQATKDRGEVMALEAWLLKLKRANQQRRLFPEQAFNRVLAERWWLVCLKADWSPWLFWRYASSLVNKAAYDDEAEKLGLLWRRIKEIILRLITKR